MRKRAREREREGGREEERERKSKNERKEESSDYSCSPVTKNELLTAAKYRTIKFTIVPYSSYLDASVPFHLFGAFKQTSSRSLSSIEPRKTENERKFLLLPLPSFVRGSLNFLRDLCLPSFTILLSTLPASNISYF